MKCTSSISLDIENEIGKIDHGRSYHFFSDGRWSLHHLISHLLHFSGPANLYASAFTISEESIRELHRLKDSGLIRRFELLIDSGLMKRKLDLLYFLGSIVDQCTMLSNHAKVVIIVNEDWQIAVVTSANLTPNIRIEAGIITTEKQIVGFYIDKFKQYLTTGIPCNLNYPQINLLRSESMPDCSCHTKKLHC